MSAGTKGEGYTLRPEDIGKRPIKVRLRENASESPLFMWRCRYCNARSRSRTRFPTVDEAARAGLKHYWDMCVTMDDLDVLDAATAEGREAALARRERNQALELLYLKDR